MDPVTIWVHSLFSNRSKTTVDRFNITHGDKGIIHKLMNHADKLRGLLSLEDDKQYFSPVITALSIEYCDPKTPIENQASGMQR